MRSPGKVFLEKYVEIYLHVSTYFLKRIYADLFQVKKLIKV